MTPDEAIDFYYSKLETGELNRTEIRTLLKEKHRFSDSEMKSILIEISNRELEGVSEKQKPFLSFFEHVYFSYFFILFGLTAVAVSIYLIWQKEAQTDLQKYLPWAVILGALFLVYKHALRIFSKR